MYRSTVDPRPFLTRHRIDARHHDELSRNMIEGAELSPAASAVARSRKFRQCAREWCRAASAEFLREMRGAR